jgi:hypothetical protein
VQLCSWICYWHFQSPAFFPLVQFCFVDVLGF